MIKRPSSIEVYQELKLLIQDNKNKENECREYLRYVDNLLFRGHPSYLRFKETEYISTPGRSDYIIAATIQDESGIDETQAYIWELKAPQCYIFEEDTKNRLVPSKDLISAENQLINYHYSLRGNEQFRSRAKITNPLNIHMGGIIIGSKNRLVKGKYDYKKSVDMYQEAMTIRKNYFYKPNDIRIITWDYILDQFSNESYTNKVFVGEIKEPIPMSISDE